MSLRMRFFALAVVVSALAVVVAPAFAQPRQPPKQPEHVALKGTIDGIMAQGPQVFVKLTTAEGQGWVAICNKASKIRVVGTAKADFLRPGINVRFNTLADRKLGKLKDDKIAKMTLFTISQEFQLGIFPDPTGKSDDDAYSVYDLNGTITSVKGNAITLAVPGFNAKLRVELTDATQIDFNFGDLSWVKQGDTLEGRGTKVDLTQMQMQMGQRMQPGRQMPGGRAMAQGAAPRPPRGITPGLGGGFQGPGAPAAGQPAAAGQAAQPGAGAQAAAAVAGDTKMPSVCNLQEGKVTKAEPLSGAGGPPARGRAAASSRSRREKPEASETPAKKE